ncbi:MAG: GNAT family protein [Rubrivivax sp.]|nr:GNAT family protein [Rubrivivax sp.]
MSHPFDKPTLAGQYVDLRPLTPDDAELTFAWRQGARAILLNQGAQTVEQQRRWIVGRPASEYNFIIETKQHRPIGMLSLVGIDAVNRVGEPGRFLIGDEHAAAGLPAAVEAMKLLYELAFNTLTLHRVWGIVASDNRRMIKWQTFLGMTQEGRLRQHLFINGRLQDAVVFGLLDDEYRSVTLPRLESLIAAARLRVAPSTSLE